ncbi:putative membrane protein YeiB [Escherichia coli]|nr:putative membrane protein YeiB [Escherichia coli]
MERNVTLDFVRGVAILGILLLNISAFGLPKAAYLNPAWYGAITPQDAWTWAFLDLIGQVKFLTLFALLFGAGLQMLLPRGRRWIQSRLTLLVLLGFIHGLLFWDGDILLAYGLVGLICWRLVRDAPSVKSLFNTGVMLYLVGLGVLLLLGLISDSQTSRPGRRMHRLFCMKNTGSFTAALKRSVIVPTVLATVYWHWAHSMAGNWQG